MIRQIVIQADNNDSTKYENTDTNNVNYPEIPSFVKAPISGVVTCLNVSDGDFSDPSQPIVSIANLNKLQVLAQVDEYLIIEVKVGQHVIIKGNGFNSEYSGVVSQIYPTANQISTDTGTSTL